MKVDCRSHPVTAGRLRSAQFSDTQSILTLVGSRIGPRPLFCSPSLAIAALIVCFLSNELPTLVAQASTPLADIQKDRIDSLRKQLSDLSAERRANAASLLSREGPAAITAADELLTLMLRSLYERENGGNGAEDAEKCRAAAFDALSELGATVGPIAIRRFRESKSDMERAALVGVMSKAYRNGDHEIEKVLFRAMNALDGDLRRSAIATVGFLRIKGAIPLVTEIVADDKRDPHDRAVAAASVGYFGKDAIGACKTLLATVQYRKNDEDLRNEAIHSLARIGLHDPVASLAILKLLENEAEPPRIRGAAANAFEIDKVAGQRMLPDLLKFLLKKKKDEEREVNRRVLVTIAELRPGKGAAAALAEFVDDDKRTAALALRALARIGPEAKSALPIVMVAIVGQRPISGAIRDGIVEDPDEWEPILRNVFGRDNAIEMIRHSMLRDDPDEEALKSMILRLSKR